MARKKYDYTDREFLLKVEGYARDGYDEAQIAEAFGINVTYFSELKGKYPELSEAINKGRRPLDIAVENSLYKRAMGLKVKKITRRWLTLPDGTKTDTEVIQEEETELPPDTGAMMCWLKHRKPAQWNLPTKIAQTDAKGEDIKHDPLSVTENKLQITVVNRSRADIITENTGGANET